MSKIEITNKEKLIIKGMYVLRITGIYANVKYTVLVTVDEETYKLSVYEIEKLYIIEINSEFEKMLKEDFPAQF